jgi:flagellar capping protein FliD
MDLQSLLGLNTRGDSALPQRSAGKSQKTPDSLAKLSPALAKARDRLVLQEQSTATSLSVLGKYKAALASLVSSAGALAKLDASSKPAAAQSALEAFVADYNAAVAGARQSAGAGSALGTSAMLSDLRRVLTQRSNPPSLRSLGIVAQPDGSLKADAAALKSGLAAAGAEGLAALAQLGTAVGKLSAAGLSGSGRLSTAMSGLDGRLAALKKQETALLDVANKMASTSADSNPISKAMQQAYLG